MGMHAPLFVILTKNASFRSYVQLLYAIYNFIVSSILLKLIIGFNSDM